MPSPFPGMNPYLESTDVWRDFHSSFCGRIKEVLAPQVQPAYIVKLEENLYLHDNEDESRQYFGTADVTVHPVNGDGGVATLVPVEAPAFLTLPEVEKWTEPFIEIRDRNSRRLVTVIELLSPTNKGAGRDREQYLAKREQLLHSSAHFVEIDLLRGFGARMPFLDKPCDYYALASRVEQRPRVGWWPLKLRDRLPVIPVPLTSPDADASLDLQAALNHVYDASFYGNYIYREPPQPRLSADDEAWAKAFLPSTTLA